ncbi:hypothetical protein OROMI_020812 [Orobanche minor]
MWDHTRIIADSFVAEKGPRKLFQLEIDCMPCSRNSGWFKGFVLRAGFLENSFQTLLAEIFMAKLCSKEMRFTHLLMLGFAKVWLSPPNLCGYLILGLTELPGSDWLQKKPPESSGWEHPFSRISTRRVVQKIAASKECDLNFLDGRPRSSRVCKFRSQSFRYEHILEVEDGSLI